MQAKQTDIAKRKVHHTTNIQQQLHSAGTAVSLFYLSFLPSSSFLLTQISLQFFFWIWLKKKFGLCDYELKCFGEEMNVSHASVHPVEEVPTTEAAVPVAGENLHVPVVRMKDIQGMPGTVGGLSLRISQFVFGAAALSIMASTSDFPSVTAFCFLVAAAGLQTLWSFSLAITDVYAILVRRSLQNYRLVSSFTIGDGVTSTLIFAAACASAGITVLIDNDLGNCAQNHCVQFETATGMAFICWFTTVPSFLLNFWSLASR